MTQHPRGEMDEIPELLARVERADGPDRELDADLYRMAFNEGGWVGGNWYVEEGGNSHVIALPAYSGSIDNALALLDRMLPLRDIMIDRMGERNRVDLALPGGRKFEITAYAKSLPLAILAALLKSLCKGPTP